MTEREGRRRRQLLDGLKEKIGYWKFKEDAIDQFGTGYGPVVREIDGYGELFRLVFWFRIGNAVEGKADFLIRRTVPAFGCDILSKTTENVSILHARAVTMKSTVPNTNCWRSARRSKLTFITSSESIRKFVEVACRELLQVNVEYVFGTYCTSQEM